MSTDVVSLVEFDWDALADGAGPEGVGEIITAYYSDVTDSVRATVKWPNGEYYQCTLMHGRDFINHRRYTASAMIHVAEEALGKKFALPF